MIDPQHPVRKYWRVILLAILLALSVSLVLGVVTFGAADDGSELGGEDAEVTNDGLTTLNFGLELAGGTRIQAPLHGHTAEGIEFDEDVSASQVERDVADEIDGVDSTDINVFHRFDDPDRQGAIEMTDEEATADAFTAALDANDIEYEEVRSGVTPESREETVRVLNNKINEAGLSGGTAREVSSAGDHYILIEIPDQRRDEVRELIQDRGLVQIDIYYPTGEVDENGQQVYDTREAVLEQGDFQSIGSGTTSDQLGPHVPVVLTDGAAERFEQHTIETGLAQGGSTCTYDYDKSSSEACLLTKVDGEVVYSAGMSPSLAGNIESGEWVHDPSFVLQTEDYNEAQQLSLHLRAGALPASLNTDAGTSTYISPTQGEHFQTAGLIIGLLAILAVTLKVHYRYRDVRVSGPMMATALSEVVILFGLASLLGYPIDLAVIGGFIAVIGTGVDDLIIIANEVLQKGDVSSERVFQSRFKKAFWVIGAAALTTIIAMSPLMVLSLGELQGFAIFTIMGVIIGVTITRPAYGDVLNYLLIEERHE